MSEVILDQYRELMYRVMLELSSKEHLSWRVANGALHISVGLGAKRWNIKYSQDKGRIERK